MLHDSFHPSLLLLLAFPNIFLLKITAFQLAVWTTTTGRHHCLAASTCVTRKTCFPLCVSFCVPYPPWPSCQVKYQRSLVWKMAHPEAIISTEEREKEKHVWSLPPSPWQRQMDVKLGLGYSPQSSGRSAKPPEPRRNTW